MTEGTLEGFWPRWVAANALAEFVGLTATLAMAAGTFAADGTAPLLTALLLAAGVAVLGAVVEGAAVGTAQWYVLRRALPRLRWRAWAIATLVGAAVAWMLGMLPSTLLARGAQSAAATGAEPSVAMQMLLAMGMGFALGPFLGVPQWLVLRRFVPRAGWWVLANSVAWAAGMPTIFLATGLIQPGYPTSAIAALVGLGCLLAGAVVGAVHGAWLLRLLRTEV